MSKKERTQISKWLNRITNLLFYSCLVIVILFVLQIFAVASFKIPSDSMQPSLFPGDCILVDKCSTGARLFNIFNSVNRKEVNIHRMPGWRKYQRNDVLVFNFPYQRQCWDSIAFDVMSYYVKRCVALPGDTLEICNGYFKIKGLHEALGNIKAQQQVALLPDSGSMGVAIRTYPWDDSMGWTIKEFGPLPVPGKGDIVKMDSLSWLLYRQLIGWEQKQCLSIDRKGVVSLGDSVVHTYRFRENYYFVAGDCSLNSQDSRYWGLLPETFIVGKAWFIWKSIDLTTGEMRWNRFLKKVH